MIPRARLKCCDIMLALANTNFLRNVYRDADMSIMTLLGRSRSSYERSPSWKRVSQHSIVARLQQESPRTEVNSAWMLRTSKFCVQRNLMTTRCSSLSMHWLQRYVIRWIAKRHLKMPAEFSWHRLLSVAKLCRVRAVWKTVRIGNLPPWQWGSEIYSQLFRTSVPPLYIVRRVQQYEFW
jgi:hypothetical protein